MRQITLSKETIESIKSYFSSMDFSDCDQYSNEEENVSEEGVEFQQGKDTVVVNGSGYGHFNECVNDRYGGYADDCSDWVQDDYSIDNVTCYDEDGVEMEITNLAELKSA